LPLGQITGSTAVTPQMKSITKLYNTMKIFLILICSLIVSTRATAQSELFKAEWAKTEKTISKIDSATNYVALQRHNFRCKRTNLVLDSHNNLEIKHFMKIKYKKGTRNKIKAVTINGQMVLIKSRYRVKLFGLKVISSFISLGNKSWLWTYKTNDAKHYTTAEIIKNWQ